MTYLSFSAVFVGVAVIAAALLLALAHHRGDKTAVPRYARAAPATALVLVALTAVFDNLMIAAGLFSYAPEHLWGVTVGRAPIEDFAYPIAGAILLPAVLEWQRSRPRRHGTGRPA